MALKTHDEYLANQAQKFIKSGPKITARITILVW